MPYLPQRFGRQGGCPGSRILWIGFRLSIWGWRRKGLRGALAYGLASAFVRTHLVSQNKWIHGGHMFYEFVLVQVLQVRD